MSFCFFQKPQEVPLSKWFCSKNWLPQHGCSATDISKLSFRLFENMVPHGTPKIQCLKNHGVSIDDFMVFFGSPYRTMLQVASFWGSPNRGRMERTVPFKDPDSLRSVRNFTQRRKSRSQSLLRFGSPDLRSLRLKQSEEVGLQEDHLLKSYGAAVIA